MRSTEHVRADGAVERWDARVGRWVAVAPAAPAQAQSGPGARAAALPAGALPFKRAQRMYGGARMTNTTLGFGSGGDTSADAELSLSLERLRARSRQLVRDSAYAKRAKTVVVNNVIGAGVGMQAQVETTRGNLNNRVNDGIEAAWRTWCEAGNCHTGGTLHFADMERMALGQVFETGEVVIRKHYRRFGDSAVPLGLEVIESERLAGELIDPGALVGVTNEMRMGVEVDEFQRPLYYWIRRGHPGDVRRTIADANRYERVPASDIFHLKVVTRWPQTRGEPWMHAVLRKLDDLSEYSQSEVAAARASAAYFGTIERPEEDPAGRDDGADDEPPSFQIDPLTVRELAPGEKLTFHTPNRPNAALDPFMRAMLREIAAGSGPSYESLSRDYSQTNYSSSRLALLEDRDLWRTLQQWWLRSFRLPLHRVWLQQAVLAGAVPSLRAAEYAFDPAKFEAVHFKPRGWSWVDPTKEVKAFKEAVLGGMATLTDVIAQTSGGQDIEDYILSRKRELQMLKDAGIEVDTTFVPEPTVATAPLMGATSGDDDDDDAPAAARVMPMRRINA